MQIMSLSELQEAIIGFVVYEVRQKLSCVTCASVLTERPNILANDRHLQVILKKHRGGLLILATSVWTLANKRAFRLLVTGDASNLENVIHVYITALDECPLVARSSGSPAS